MANKYERSTRSEADDRSDSFEAYLEYNRVLRTWFVAFGVGGPALFLVNDTVAKRLVAEGELQLIVLLFLVGAGAQVVGALINKVANWYDYYSALDENPQRWIYRASKWLVHQFWMDAVLDVLTIGFFGYAAWILLTVFANS